MIIYSVIVASQNPSDKSIHIYSREYDLSKVGFFAKNGVKESFKFVCRESCGTLPRGSRHTCTHETEYVIHIAVSSTSQTCAYAFCDSSYPRRIAFKMLEQVIQKFEKEVGDACFKTKGDENINIGLPAIFKQYQDPKKMDALTSAQDKADQITVTLHENIRKLLERGENLEELVVKSKDLSTQSKQFYKDTKK